MLHSKAATPTEVGNSTLCLPTPLRTSPDMFFYRLPVAGVTRTKPKHKPSKQTPFFVCCRQHSIYRRSGAGIGEGKGSLGNRGNADDALSSNRRQENALLANVVNFKQATPKLSMKE